MTSASVTFERSTNIDEALRDRGAESAGAGARGSASAAAARATDRSWRASGPWASCSSRTGTHRRGESRRCRSRAGPGGTVAASGPLDREHAKRGEVADDRAIAARQRARRSSRARTVACGWRSCGDREAVRRTAATGSRSGRTGRRRRAGANTVLKSNVSSICLRRYPAISRAGNGAMRAIRRSAHLRVPEPRDRADKRRIAFEPVSGSWFNPERSLQCRSRCVKCWKPASTSATRRATGIRRWPSTSSASATRSTSSTSKRRCSSTRTR